MNGSEPIELDLAYTGPDPLGEERWTTLLSSWLAALQAEMPAPLQSVAYSLGLQFCDDAAIAELNGQWRQQPKPTDVLSFAAQDDAPEPIEGLPIELGDIVISIPTATRQAPDHGHSLEQELLFLASHGLLHLLGWDHPDEQSLAAMLHRQEALVQGAAL